MLFREFIKRFTAFKTLTLSEKILYAGYYLHTQMGQERIKPAAINALFEEAHIERPSNAGSQMNWLTTGQNKRLLKDSKGFRLSASTREHIASLMPADKTGSSKQATIDLKQLETQVTEAAQKTFLQETIVCFEHGAFRASIVMAWNLAYHHTCSYILSGHLTVFNAQLERAFPKKKAIAKHSDFEDLKESEVIAVAKGAQILSKSTSSTLSAKLDIRNMAAHPSSTLITPIKAEEVITDLIQNVILRSTL